MTRKDVILISALVNAGLLALLFVTAIRPQEEGGALTEIAESDFKPTPPIEIIASTPSKAEPIDVVDSLIQDYLPPTPRSEDLPFVKLKPQLPISPVLNANTVEVTVKRGDSLDKLARSNGTTVDAIRKTNNLKTDKLYIGQILKVPAGTAKKETALPAAPIAIPKPVASSDPVYYTVKNGDNPWKIAKQFQLNLDDLLKLNTLDEESARNMRVGDKIRVR